MHRVAGKAGDVAVSGGAAWQLRKEATNKGWFTTAPMWKSHSPAGDLRRPNDNPTAISARCSRNRLRYLVVEKTGSGVVGWSAISIAAVLVAVAVVPMVHAGGSEDDTPLTPERERAGIVRTTTLHHAPASCLCSNSRTRSLFRTPDLDFDVAVDVDLPLPSLHFVSL